MNFACATAKQCYGPLWEIPYSDELAVDIVSLGVAAIVFWIVFIYLDAVLPTEFGVPKSPLFFIHDLMSCCKRKQNDLPSPLAEEDSERTSLLIDAEDTEEDPDVRKMRQLIQAHQYS